ncbi:SDR family oxidoreductase [Sphingobacterium siyangense]|uniref:SDR family oxidoreductase n=1 Tax=Sphingobacterium siyangense TaxID=459529 RepID=UPI003C78D3BB
MHKYAIVTGSSDRIGKAIALQLTNMGYNLILHYNHSLEKVHNLQSEIKNKGRDALLFHLDFLSSDSIDEKFKEFKDKGYNIELLINNASDYTSSDFTTAGINNFRMQMQINFESPYLFIKAFANNYNSGCIINMLDTKIKKDCTNHLDYILSKKMLRELTNLAAYKLAPNFRVNGIAPGLILPPNGKDEDYLKLKAQTIPLRITGDLSDIQQTVTFLAESPFITGQVIYVDGGEHLACNTIE